MRAACAPGMFILACFGYSGSLLAAILCAGFLSDIFDGVVARRTGTVTAALRRADTLVDTGFYAAAAVALSIAVPRAFEGAGLELALLVAVHVSRATFELAKFGRLSAYHMWSSKALGVLLVTTMTAAFVSGRPNVLIVATVWLAVLNELEGFVASVVLAAWTADVPSVLHAYRIAHRN